MPFRMSGSGRETLPDVPEGWESLPDVREWSGGPPECPGVVGSSSRLFESGRETLPNVWDTHQDSRELSEALPDVW